MDEAPKTLVLNLVLIATCAVVIYFFYSASQSKKHVSQPRLKSFLILLGWPLGAVITLVVLMEMLDPISNVRHGEPTLGMRALSAFFVGAIIASVIAAWRAAIRRIARPVNGYTEPKSALPKEVTKTEFLPKSEYVQKYRVTESVLGAAIANKRISAELINGELHVENRKIK